MGRRNRPAMNCFISTSSAAQTTVPLTHQKRCVDETKTIIKQQHHREKSIRRVRSQTRGVTALMYACQQGNVDKVRRILRAQVRE